MSKVTLIEEKVAGVRGGGADSAILFSHPLKSLHLKKEIAHIYHHVYHFCQFFSLKYYD